MEEVEEDKIANDVLEGLPPSFMVFGTKKELDPIEEFWMNKLTNIEKQYDLHIVDLEKKLLSNRASRRSIKKQTARITELEEELAERTAQIENLKSSSGALKGKLTDKEYEANALQVKLERADLAAKNVAQRMLTERQSRREYEKECTGLKNRLKRLEKEKAQLQIDMEIKESEKAQIEEREAVLGKEKWSFVRNLTEVDAERRVQTNANLRLCEDIEKLLGVEKSLEANLLKERRLMGDMMTDIKMQRQEHHDALRHLDMAIKEKRDAEDALNYSSKKTENLERRVNHWKEEFHFKELDNASQTKELRDLKQRNSNIRCVLADTRQKLNLCLSDMKSLENEKRRADVELESAKRQEQALHLEMKKNELRKCQLAEKILKANPYLLTSAAARKGRRTSSTDESQVSRRQEIESYKKRIWKLEKHRDDVERKLRDLQRKENVYRMKFQKYAGMEKEIFWTGKAMAKLEGDRNRLESLLKTMELNMPMKVPFQKLVTDPSVLDRLAKNKILQKRIFHQAEKIEELKSNARRILQYREEEFAAMSQLPEEIPHWKLSHWYKSQMQITPEIVFSGMHIDMKKPWEEARVAPLRSFADNEYYRNYMHFLNNEIPKLKDEISHLEKKKMYLQAEKEVEETSRKKSKGETVERMNLTGLLADDEKQVPEAHDEGEDDDDGQCTPELSMHGSSFDHTGHPAPLLVEVEQEDEANKKTPKIQKQDAETKESSSTEDERDDQSSGAASEIPSDKSSAQ